MRPQSLAGRILAAAAVVLVASAGVAAAVAAVAATTGTVSVCATATTPSHTVAVDGTAVATLPGDAATQCATTTYTVPTVTQTVTVTAPTSTASTTTTTTSASLTYDQAIAYTQTPPLFVPIRTVTVSTAAAWRTALSNLKPGDLVQAASPFTVTGETVIKNRLDSPAELDLTGISFVYSGGLNLPAVWLDNAQNLYIYNGDLSTADTGGACLLDYGSQHVTWWGFKAHDCGGGGVGLMPVNGPVDHDDFQGEIWKVGQNLAWDPHTEKGSGLHAVLLDDVSNTNPFTNNRLAFYAHDIPTGACVQAGNNLTPTAANGNTLYLKCINETYVSTIQTGGNALQFWGDTSNLGLDVKYLEGDNLQGQALAACGVYSGQTLAGVTVEYGRASNVNLNTLMACNTQPWDTTHGVVYGDVQPTP